MVRGQVTAQSVAHLLFRRLFPRCSTPAQALATFSSLTLARGAPNLCHVPAPLQGALRNVEPPRFPLDAQYSPASKGRAGDSPCLASCGFHPSSSFSTLRLGTACSSLDSVVPGVSSLSAAPPSSHACAHHTVPTTLCIAGPLLRSCSSWGPSPACTPSGLPGAGARERVTAASEL